MMLRSRGGVGCTVRGTSQLRWVAGGPSSTTMDALDGMARRRASEFEATQAARRSTMNQKAQPATTPAGTRPTTARQAQQERGTNASFVRKLHQMNSDAEKRRKETPQSKRHEAKQRVMLDERRRMLRFREVDVSLDALILKRDLFLWLTVLRKGGKEHMIDQTLERELRFYTEMSNKEIRYSPKLFAGLPALMKGHSFPTLQGLTRLSVCPAAQQRLKEAEYEEFDQLSAAEAAAAIEARKQSRKEQQSNLPAPVPGAGSSHRPSASTATPLGVGAAAGNVMISRATFTRPTLVTVSPMTYGSSMQQYSDEWIELLRGKPGDNAPAKEDGTGATKKEIRPLFRADQFDVLRLMTADMQSVKWGIKLCANSYAQKMSPADTRETLYGVNLVRPFMSQFHLRNFSTTYCFLVGADGRIRWMSAGAPLPEERLAFPKLLHELEMEFLRKK